MEYKNCGQPTKIHNITLYNCDCMQLLKETPDKYYELAIVDPPYGIGADKSNNNAGSREKNNGWKAYKETDWDNEIPKKEYWAELFRISKNQIVWGGNYMTEFLKPSMGWVIWDKGQRDFSLADGEMAWTSFDKAMRIFTYSRGKHLADKNKEGGGIHPTQKPVALYKWLLKNYAKEGDKILDTHCGSGSIAIATHYMGFSLTACELDKEYFDSAVERITNQTRQQTLI